MAHLFCRPLVANEIETTLTPIINSLSVRFGGEANFSFSLSVSFNVSALDFSISHKPPNKGDDWHREMSDKLAPLKDFHYLDITTWTLTISIRPSSTLNITYGVEKTGAGRITIPDVSNPNQGLTPSVVVAILRALEGSLPLSSRQRAIQSSLPEIERDQLEYQQQILAELQSASTRLTKEASEFVVSSEVHLQRRSEELELSFQRRNEKLEGTFQRKQDLLSAEVAQLKTELEASSKTQEKRLLAEFASSKKDLEEREKALEDKNKALDLRDATAARRAGQKQIQLVVEQQKEVRISPETHKKRRTVHYLCALGLACFGSLASLFLYQIVTTTTEGFRWQLAVPLSTGLIGFTSTLVYWIKWSDDWFREHARAEFANRKLYSDTNRAAWLVEVLLEWSREGKEAIPGTVVESLTKNLFTDLQGESPAHAQDVLQRFITKLARIRVSNNEIELGGSRQSGMKT